MRLFVTRPAINIFYCYARKDKALRDTLEQHLEPLRRSGQIISWYDREIQPGMDWRQEIDKYLNNSDIILVLVSPSFLSSNYCSSVEMQRALERHEAKETLVIPIILRPSDWKETPLGKLQALPKDGKPLTKWRNRDEAFQDIVQGIRQVIKTYPIRKTGYLPSNLHVDREFVHTDKIVGGGTGHTLNLNDPEHIFNIVTNGNPVLSDSLSKQSSNSWQEGSYPGYSFFFQEGAYHIKLKKPNEVIASLIDVGSLRSLSHNLAIQVEMTVLMGEGGGLVFRAATPESELGFRFFLGQDYNDLVYNEKIVGTSVAVKADIGQSYVLTSIAYGNDLLIYVDRKCVIGDQFERYIYIPKSGKVGLMAVNFGFETHVMFRNLQIWDLEQQAVREADIIHTSR